MQAPIIQQIQEHLQSGGVVAIVTATRQTVYSAKHAALFVADKENHGVYIKHGKRLDFVFPAYIKFGRYV